MKKIENYEEMLIDYCEANPLIQKYQDSLRKYEIIQKAPEYKTQSYTFKYGNYKFSDYLLAD